jgi:hypothetical protein
VAELVSGGYVINPVKFLFNTAFKTESILLLNFFFAFLKAIVKTNVYLQIFYHQFYGAVFDER